MFIGALLKGDPRHAEAREIVDMARHGQLAAATTVGILCEVYAALTWEQAQPRHSPAIASGAVMAIIQSPSRIRLLTETPAVLSRTMELAKKHTLKARRIHDARHAATALVHQIRHVITYDTKDWKRFIDDGLEPVVPSSLLNKS